MNNFGIKCLNKPQYGFLLFVLFVSILIDNINGYLQVKYDVYSYVGVVFRLIVFFILLKYVLRHKIALSISILITFSLFSLFVSWNYLYNTSIVKEIDQISNILYLYLFVIYFFYEGPRFEARKIFKYVHYYGFTIALIIVICFIFDIGNKSYGEDYGFGTKGFFKAGNDLGLSLIFTLCFSFLYHKKYSDNNYTLLRSLLIAISCVLIGSRAGMILSFVITLYYLIYLGYSRSKYRVFVVFIVVILMPYMLFKLYSLFDEYTLNRLTLEGFSSARIDLVIIAKQHIDSFDEISFVIGKGASSLLRYVGNSYNYGEYRAVEQDYYEIVGSYGYGISVLIFSPFIFETLCALNKWFKQSNLDNSFYLMMSVLFLLIGYLAGHAIKNVMLAPLYGILYSIVYNKIRE